MEPIFDLDVTGFSCHSAPRSTGRPDVQCRIVEYGQELAFSELPRTLPHNYLLCAVIHCRLPPIPAFMSFLYYLREPLGDGVCVLTFKRGKANLKRYRAAMKLTGYHNCGISLDAEFFTLRETNFSSQTRTHLNRTDITKRSSCRLLKDLREMIPDEHPKVLEVFPSEGTFSEEAIKHGCHTTVVIGPDQENRGLLRSRFQERFNS